MHEKRQSSTRVDYTVTVWMTDPSRWDKCGISTSNVGISPDEVDNKLQSGWVTLAIL